MSCIPAPQFPQETGLGETCDVGAVTLACGIEPDEVRYTHQSKEFNQGFRIRA